MRAHISKFIRISKRTIRIFDDFFNFTLDFAFAVSFVVVGRLKGRVVAEEGGSRGGGGGGGFDEEENYAEDCCYDKNELSYREHRGSCRSGEGRTEIRTERPVSPAGFVTGGN